jgi:hypothetical protein
MRSSLLGILVLLIIAVAPVGAAVGGGGGGMSGGGELGGAGAGNNGSNNGNNVNQPIVPSLISLKFDVVINTPGTVKVTPSMLYFREKTVESDFLGKWNIDSLPFQETPKGDTGVLFTASMRDDDGNSLKMTGEKAGDAIKGTIVVHQVQGNVTTTYSFHGGIPGSLEGIAAKKEGEQGAGDHH